MFYAKSDLKTCIATSMTRNFWFDLFDLVTSDVLDLKLLRMVPQSVLDTIHTNRLASFACNIVSFRANAIKPETGVGLCVMTGV